MRLPWKQSDWLNETLAGQKNKFLCSIYSHFKEDSRDQSHNECDEGQTNLNDCEDGCSHPEAKIASDGAKKGGETLKTRSWKIVQLHLYWGV